MRILIVDDDVGMRDFCVFLCASACNAPDIVTAKSLAEARTQLSQSFDLVMTDCQLPDGSGVDLIREILQHQPNAPIFFMTAGTNETLVAGRRAGATWARSKPFNIAEFVSIVAGLQH